MTAAAALAAGVGALAGPGDLPAPAPDRQPAPDPVGPAAAEPAGRAPSAAPAPPGGGRRRGLYALLAGDHGAAERLLGDDAAGREALAVERGRLALEERLAGLGAKFAGLLPDPVDREALWREAETLVALARKCGRELGPASRPLARRVQDTVGRLLVALADVYGPEVDPARADAVADAALELLPGEDRCRRLGLARAWVHDQEAVVAGGWWPGAERE